MLREVNKFLIVFIGVILVCGVVSASWNVEITSPVNNSQWGYKISKFSWNTDIALNNLNDVFIFSINGNINDGLTNRSGGLEEAIESDKIVQGWNNLQISVTNNTGYTENDSVNFWVDSISPVLDYITPSGNLTYTNQDSFNFQFWLNETNPNYNYDGNLLRLMLWKPGNFHIWTSDINMSSAYLSDIVSHNLDSGNKKEGNYSWTVFSKDQYSNGTEIRDVNLTGIIIRDTISPLVSIISPLNNSNVSGFIWVNISVYDGLSGINHTIINITNSSGQVDFDLLNETESSWNWNTTNLLEGNYTIKATTYDKAGNSNFSEINVIVDNTAPVSDDDAPSFWMNNDFNVTINASDFGSGVAYINYSLNGSGWIQVFGNETKVLISESGNQSLEYFAVDNAGNIETTNLVYVLLDKIAPTTTTDFDSSKWYNTDVTITLNATDSGSGIKEIWYKINNNDWNNSLGDNLSILVSDEGINNLTYFAVDNAGNNETDKTIQVMIDNTAPTIFIQSPINTTIYNTNTIWFNATADDEIKNWIVNYNGTNVTPAGINSSLEIIDGSYNLLIYAEDKAGNIGLNDSIWFNVDTTGPEISLIESPLNNSIFNWETRTQTIKFNASDLSGVDTCRLFVDGSLQNLALPVLPSSDGFKKITLALTNDYTNISNYSAGTHSWYIICNDSLGNPRQTETKKFTILSNFTEAGDYNYTNLTDELDVSNVTYFYVNNTYGMINFTESINFSTGFDWSQFIDISDLKIYVNSSFSELNKTAILTFYNVTFTTPEVLKDGAVYCSSAGTNCPIFNYDKSANILIISVNGFTEYTVREKPVESPPAPSSGGSSSCRYEENYNWGCSAWSECTEGIQTRTCKESNNCGNDFGKPATEQTCIMPEQEVEEIIEETPIVEEEQVQPSGAGITGAVIGFAKSGKGIASFVFIALVSAGGIGVVLFRRYR